MRQDFFVAVAVIVVEAVVVAVEVAVAVIVVVVFVGVFVRKIGVFIAPSCIMQMQRAYSKTEKKLSNI